MDASPNEHIEQRLDTCPRKLDQNHYSPVRVQQQPKKERTYHFTLQLPLGRRRLAVMISSTREEEEEADNLYYLLLLLLAARLN